MFKLPEFKLPDFKLSDFKLPEFNLNFGDYQNYVETFKNPVIHLFIILILFIIISYYKIEIEFISNTYFQIFFLMIIMNRIINSYLVSLVISVIIVKMININSSKKITKDESKEKSIYKDETEKEKNESVVNEPNKEDPFKNGPIIGRYLSKPSETTVWKNERVQFNSIKN